MARRGKNYREGYEIGKGWASKTATENQLARLAAFEFNTDIPSWEAYVNIAENGMNKGIAHGLFTLVNHRNKHDDALSVAEFWEEALGDAAERLENWSFAVGFLCGASDVLDGRRTVAAALRTRTGRPKVGADPFEEGYRWASEVATLDELRSLDCSYSLVCDPEDFDYLLDEWQSDGYRGISRGLFRLIHPAGLPDDARSVQAFWKRVLPKAWEQLEDRSFAEDFITAAYTHREDSGAYAKRRRSRATARVTAGRETARSSAQQRRRAKK